MDMGGGSPTNRDITQHRVAFLREPLLRECLAAEFVGTFFLVATVGTSVVGGGGLAAVAIGLVLGIQVYTFGSVSGGFFNPAVVLAVLLSGRGKISKKQAAMYAAVECFGSLVGACCAFLATDGTFYFDYGKTQGWRASLTLEILFTMLLCGTVLVTGTSNDAPNHYFGFAIGLSVTGGALASGGFDQGSFNPAVTLGINLVNFMNPGPGQSGPCPGSWIIFLIAPLLGGALAAGVFRGTRGNEFQFEGKGQQATSEVGQEQTRATV